MRKRQRAGSGRALRLALRLVFALGSSGASVAAEDLVTSLPHTLYRGPPSGIAVTFGVDWGRTRRAAELPVPASAAVLWKRQIPGGVSCNVLIDAAGRIFVAGLGRVTQLDRHGTREYSQRADFSSAAAAALLADGTRVVLTRERRLMSWSRRGAPGVDIELGAPSRFASSTLLPLPDGSLLVSIGPWLLNSSGGKVQDHVELKDPVEHTLVVGRRVIAIDDKGNVFEWSGRSTPRARGSFGGRLTAAAVSSPEALLGVVSNRAVVELSLTTGNLRELARFPAPGLLSVLAVPADERAITMQTDGTLVALGATLIAYPRQSAPESPTDVQLLASPDGSVAWMASNASLRLQGIELDARELPDVRCAQLASLVPAGPSKLAVACSSGQVWLIGRSERSREDADESAPPH